MKLSIAQINGFGGMQSIQMDVGSFSAHMVTIAKRKIPESVPRNFLAVLCFWLSWFSGLREPLGVSSCKHGGDTPNNTPNSMFFGGIECSTMVRIIAWNRPKTQWLYALKRSYVQVVWCPGEDSNFHDHKVTGTWSQRVYQFRHLGMSQSIRPKTCEALS